MAEKKDALSFIPKPIRNMVTNLLCKELKKENIKSMILVFDDKKEGTEAFDAEFYPGNVLEEYEALKKKYAALEIRVKVLEKRK